jgi:hypothetical protein
MQCSVVPLGVNRRFGGTYRIARNQDRRSQKQRGRLRFLAQSGVSAVAICFQANFLHCIFLFFRYDTPKRRFTFNRLHRIISLKIIHLNPLVHSFILKNVVFWDVTPCGSCKNRRFVELSASIIRVTRIGELGT